jgi:steroid 5-alpha reductase family enzyme
VFPIEHANERHIEIHESRPDRMNRAERQSVLAVPVILAIGVAIAWAGSQGGERVGEWPIFALCAGLCFGINWLVFVHAYKTQSERFFDLTGSLTYATVVCVAIGLSEDPNSRALLLGLLILIWAARLGSFLFMRIRQDGSDGRFDDLKPSFARFFMTWTLQGLWVLLTGACALAAMTTGRNVPLGAAAAVGLGLWILGFGIEVAADRAKRRFRADPDNRDRFIRGGIWAWSRHPNYFGEIALWIGIALIALPALSGWQYATLISPVFVYILLTRVSGVPLLESRAKKRWGDDPEYRAYRERTPVLLMRPPGIS